MGRAGTALEADVGSPQHNVGAPFSVLVGDSSAPGPVQYCWNRAGIAKPVGKWLQEHTELRSFWTLLLTRDVCSQILEKVPEQEHFTLSFEEAVDLHA